MRNALAILIGLVATAALAACGDDPAPVKTIAASEFSDPESGIAFRAPAGARIGDGKGVQVVVLRRGASTLVISRFERHGERLPKSGKDLIRASEALKREYAARNHMPNTDSVGVTLRMVDGRDRLMVSDGKGQHYHLYEYGSEIVVDVVAPDADFHRAWVTLFDPVLDSLKITKPRD